MNETHRPDQPADVARPGITGPVAEPVTEPFTAPITAAFTAPTPAPITAPMTAPISAPITAPIPVPSTSMLPGNELPPPAHLHAHAAQGKRRTTGQDPALRESRDAWMNSVRSTVNDHPLSCLVGALLVGGVIARMLPSRR